MQELLGHTSVPMNYRSQAFGITENTMHIGSSRNSLVANGCSLHHVGICAEAIRQMRALNCFQAHEKTMLSMSAGDCAAVNIMVEAYSVTIASEFYS